MKTQKENVTFRIHPQLRKILEMVAEEERRSFSSQLNVALEEWVQIREELHPRFVQDIKEALGSGKAGPVWKG